MNLDWLFGKSGVKPETPEVGAFAPYTQEYDPTALKELLESYGQQQRKGIYERAASKGTYYGAGGTMPGEIELAQTQEQILAQAYMQQEKMQQMAIQQQYLAWVGQKYGLQSMEYQNAFNEYQRANQARSGSRNEFLGGIFDAIGTGAGSWAGAGFPMP